MARSTLRRGFSLVEMLVVIAIIGVLVSIVLVAGRKVRAGGMDNSTRDVIRVLDLTLDTYMTAKDGVPAASMYVAIDGPLTVKRTLPVSDARNGDSLVDTPGDLNMVNASGLFLLQLADIPTAKAQLEGIPAKFMGQKPILGGTAATQRKMLTPIDAWGNAIRFVHPAFDGVIKSDPTANPGSAVLLDSPQFPQRKLTEPWAITMIRRNNVSDSDGGRCVGKRPYFYSAGEDGDASTNADNIYTTPPTFSKN